MAHRLVVVLAMVASMALFSDDFGADAAPIVKSPTTPPTPKTNAKMLYFNGYRRYLGWWYPRHSRGYNRYPIIQYPVHRPQFPPVNRPMYPPFNRPLYPPAFMTPAPPIIPPRPPLMTPTPFPPIIRPQYPRLTPTPYPGINRPPFQTPYPYPGGFPGNRPFVPWTPYPAINRPYPTVRPGYNTPGFRSTALPRYPGYRGQFPVPTMVPNFGYPGLNNPYPYGPLPYKKSMKAPLKRSVKKMAEGG